MNQQNTDEPTQDMTTPIDDMINLVEQWIRHPNKINEQSLMSLKADLKDLKSSIDEEEMGEGEPTKKPTLSIIIGHMKKGENQ